MASQFSISVEGVTMPVLDVPELTERAKAPLVKESSGTLTLVRSRGGDAKMDAWNKSSAKKNCTLVMYNASGAPVKRYNLTMAWPSKVEVTKGSSGHVPTEEISLVYHRID